MKYLILILKDFGYPFLDRMLTDVKLAGITVMPLLATGGSLLTPGEGGKANDAAEGLIPEDKRACCYIVTDCDDGVRLARRYGIGYVYKETPAAGGEHINPGTNDAQCFIQSFEGITADFLVKMYERFHHLPWTILETERLILREMTVDDVDRLYEIYAEPGITDYMEPLYADRQQEIEYTRDYIKNMYEFCGYGLWLVIEKEGAADSEGIKENGAADINGRVVGRVGITGREGFEEAELGYVIEKSRQNRGYATEACRAVMDYARDVLDMKGLNCFIRPGNDISEKLCKLLGFKCIEKTVLSGVDMYRYHIDL